MKLCKRAIEALQIINDYGDIRQCGWLCDGGVIGRLLDQDIKEIFHGKRATEIREQHARRDYSNCNPNACPYVACDNVDEIEIDELPEYPESIMLAYENVCNYKCIMCNIPGCMAGKDMEEREKRLDKLDEKLNEILPYVKKISANGLGELFVSKHTMNLLANWKPVADPSEIEVSLETNGSLFNEENWKKISNLGQYYLSVHITVLSFDSKLYQEMSGTSLPVENIINNLKFVKSLREKGIINYVELATVVQEKNFREMPEFARRCVEEFGADYVRLRPYESWLGESFEEWFKDIRNEYHPYNKEYLEIMKHPYLKHPKVHDWSGGRKSELGPEPYKKIRTRYAMLEKMYAVDSFTNSIKEVWNKDKIVIYGMAVVGKACVSLLKENFNIEYIIDKGKVCSEYMGVKCFGLDELAELPKDALVLISLERDEDEIIKVLSKMGYSNLIPVRTLLHI